VSVLKLSLLGTILSSLLLTTGASFLLGGINRMEQFFNVTVAQMVSMLLLLAVSSLIIPSTARLMTSTSTEGILAQSRRISVVILISYVLWLAFTLVTHRSKFNEPSMKVPKRPARTLPEGAANRSIAAIGAGGAAATGGSFHVKRIYKDPNEEYQDDEEDFETCSLSLTGAIITLVVSVVFVAFNTQFATDSIQALLQRRKVSQTFLSLIILPLLSNDPMAVNMAIQDKMDISISLALERCMQTCLMVVPLTVLLAWCMGVNEMDLDFDGFSIATLFVSIIIITYVVQEGKSNWYVSPPAQHIRVHCIVTARLANMKYRLTGALLIKVFIIIALAAFYIP
jgi:Ca2+:H+ antiporter